MRVRVSLAAVVPLAIASGACGRRVAPAPATVSGVSAAGTASAASVPDTAEARRVFVENIDAIHKRDRARYLATYLESSTLARTGPGGMELGFENWSARRDSTWPDTLVARDLRVVPVAPGVVYGTYHYRVTQAGQTSEGVSERVFVRTPAGWRIAATSAFGLPAGASPPPLALVGGTLVNPGAPPVTNAAVVMRGGRIVCAGPRGAGCEPPADAEVVDVRGAFVAPGLIDAHVHFSQSGWVDARPDAIDLRAELPYDSVVAALRAHPERYGRAYLCSGVTGVYDVGGYPWTMPLAERSAGALDLPRVVAAGPLLSTVDHWLNLPALRQFVYMRDDSTVRAAVRASARMSAGAIKVWYIQVPDTARPRARALLGVAADEARRVRLPLIVHATELARAKEAVDAGARVLVHIVAPDTLDDAFIAALKRRGTIVVPTLTVREGYADVFRGRAPSARYPLDCVDRATRANLERALPADKRQRGLARIGAYDSTVAASMRNLKRLYDAGVPIAMGTDAGNPGTAHGPSVYREMEAMQRSGMPAPAVFASATIGAARAMGLEKEVGSLEAGKEADVVVLEADPTADIANARRVRLVVRNGALYGRRELLPAEDAPRP